jgi:hypothetical protein
MSWEQDAPLLYRSSIVSKDGSVHGDVQCEQTKKKVKRKTGKIRLYLMSSDAFMMHKFVTAFTDNQPYHGPIKIQLCLDFT